MDPLAITGLISLVNATGAAIALIIHAWRSGRPHPAQPRQDSASSEQNRSGAPDPYAGSKQLAEQEHARLQSQHEKPPGHA